MMEKKKKKRGGKTVVAGGVIGLIIYFLMQGSLLPGLFDQGDTITPTPSQVVEDIEDETPQDNLTIVEVIDNQITVDGKGVTLETIIETLGDAEKVIFRAKDAKQITYDEVKNLLLANQIILIEE